MSMNKMMMAGGLAVALLGSASHAQMIGGDLTVDGSREDVIFLGGDITVTGEIEGSVSGIAGDARIDANVSGDIEFFGGEADISGRVDGDIDLAGGSVRIRADVGRDVNAAGGDVTVSGAIGGELNAAGGSVELDAVVQGETNVGGGYVLLPVSSSFYGRMEIAAGEIEFLGTAHDTVDIEAGTAIISGTFNDDLEILAERVRILEGATVTGELRIRGPHEPEVAEGASITVLEYEYESYNFGAEDWEDIDIHIEGPWEFFDAPFEFFGGMFVGSAFLLGFLIVLIAPRSVSNIAASFRRRPVSSGFVGFVAFAMSPILLAVLSLLLVITVIGIPLIPLMIMLYPVMLFLSFIFGGIAVGDLIFNRNRPNAGLGLAMRALSLLVVLVALLVLGAIPGLGALSGLVVMCIGLGAWLLSFGNRDNRRETAEENRFDDEPEKRDPEPVDTNAGDSDASVTE